MRDEENDIRIREAADNYHPAYDDTAWDKMEKLLDEHLPQKKERRKIFFILPFLLLLGGLILFIVWSNRKNYSSEPPGISLQQTQTGKLKDTNKLPDNLSGQSINKSLDKQKIPAKIRAGSPIILSNTNTNKIKTNQASYFSIKSTGNKKYNFKGKLPVQYNVLLNEESNAEENNKNKLTINTEPNSSIPARGELLNNNNDVISEENKNRIDSTKTDSQPVYKKPQIEKQDTIAKSEITKKRTKNTNGFSNNLGITFSSGPSISSVHINNAGKISVIYGAGLNYSISKSFTIRTGFYKSKKIYSVGKYDYHFPDGGGSYYGNLQSIDANCDVDEIPLNLYYNFAKKENHNWFVSTGLSSYLMKKESYEYYYKTPTGEIYNKDVTIKNKNKNLFSVLNFSTGYQYNFNKKFFIMAEPYINLPLSGIGVGKVKLNSGGILFTVTMKPLLKK